MSTKENLKLVTKFTSALTDIEISEFLRIQNLVFGGAVDFEWFKVKYLRNPYGESVITLGYVNGECVCARGLWRNDLNQIIAYQPCDSAVHPEYRRLGFFKKATLSALSLVEKSSLIYNFPNDKSYGAYKALGWVSLSLKKRLLINFLNRKRHIKNINAIDSKYIEWLAMRWQSTKKPCVYHIEINSTYLIAKKIKWNLYTIIGACGKKEAEQFPIAKIPILFMFHADGTMGRGLLTAVKIPENINYEIDIPTYKIDTFF